MTSFNTITLTAEDKKGKGGVNSVLVLMKEMLEFQDKIGACLESQTNPEYKEKLEKFQKYLELMYKELLAIAARALEDRRSVAKEVEKQPEMITTIPELGMK